MMEMLEDIISLPIFIQLSTFALKLAMILFYIEIVSIAFEYIDLPFLR